MLSLDCSLLLAVNLDFHTLIGDGSRSGTVLRNCEIHCSNCCRPQNPDNNQNGYEWARPTTHITDFNQFKLSHVLLIFNDAIPASRSRGCPSASHFRREQVRWHRFWIQSGNLSNPDQSIPMTGPWPDPHPLLPPSICSRIWASTAAMAVMFRIRRGVALVVRMWTGLLRPIRIGPMATPSVTTRTML